MHWVIKSSDASVARDTVQLAHH